MLTVSRKALLVHGSDQAYQQVAHDFFAFGTQMRRVREQLAALLGLTGSAYAAVIAIAHWQKKSGVTVNQLAEHLHISNISVTIEVKKLVAVGIVRKRSDKKDRRRVLLTLTAKGRAMLGGIAPVRCQVNDAVFESLSKKEFTSLCVIMKKLVARKNHVFLYINSSPVLTAAGLKRPKSARLKERPIHIHQRF